MPNFTYYDNIPNAPNDPSQDQPKMQQNTNSTDQLISQDHVTFNLNNGGWHNLIHMIAQAKSISDPSQAGQFYTSTPVNANFTTDPQLWYKSPATQAGLPGQQLTGNNAVANNGWVFCAGIIFQWGFISIPGNGTPTDVPFTPNFPSNNLWVNITPDRISGSSNSFAARLVDKTKFQITQTNSNSVAKNFFWIAIGN